MNLYPAISLFFPSPPYILSITPSLPLKMEPFALPLTLQRVFLIRECWSLPYTSGKLHILKTSSNVTSVGFLARSISASRTERPMSDEMNPLGKVISFQMQNPVPYITVYVPQVFAELNRCRGY